MNTKLGMHVLYSSRSTCIDPEVKGKGHTVTKTVTVVSDACCYGRVLLLPACVGMSIRLPMCSSSDSCIKVTFSVTQGHCTGVIRSTTYNFLLVPL